MKFESEIIYQLPISLKEWYIRREYNALNIKEFYKKEVEGMFDIEKIKEFYADAKAKRDEAVEVALVDLDRIVEERFELAKEELAKQVREEIVAKAEAPYKHDIDLCESFLVEETTAEEEVVAEENNVEVGGEY